MKKTSIPREHYDGDSYYFYRNENNLKTNTEKKLFAIRGDTMISFFTPYKMAIKRKIGLVYNKDLDCLNELIRKKDEAGYKDVNREFERFINLYHSRGNLLLLPERVNNIQARMNPDRYACSEDRIDKSLYECFPGGKLSKYFENKIGKVQEWVKEEHLEMLFEGEIVRENIIKFTSLDIGKYYKDMSAEDIYDFIDKMVGIIEERNIYFNINKS